MREVLFVPTQMSCIMSIKDNAVVGGRTLMFLVKYILTWKNPHFPNGPP